MAVIEEFQGSGTAVMDIDFKKELWSCKATYLGVAPTHTADPRFLYTGMGRCDSLSPDTRVGLFAAGNQGDVERRVMR